MTICATRWTLRHRGSEWKGQRELVGFPERKTINMDVWVTLMQMSASVRPKKQRRATMWNFIFNTESSKSSKKVTATSLEANRMTSDSMLITVPPLATRFFSDSSSSATSTFHPHRLHGSDWAFSPPVTRCWRESWLDFFFCICYGCVQCKVHVYLNWRALSSSAGGGGASWSAALDGRMHICHCKAPLMCIWTHEVTDLKETSFVVQLFVKKKEE